MAPVKRYFIEMENSAGLLDSREVPVEIDPVDGDPTDKGQYTLNYAVQDFVNSVFFRAGDRLLIISEDDR